MFPTHLLSHTVDVAATGSRVIVSPPVLHTDEDYVVLVQDFHAFDKLLKSDGWVVDGKEYAIGAPWSTAFRSYRKGEINLIVTADIRFFARYKLATKIATVLNLTDKTERIALFQMIRDLPPATYGTAYATF
jgi:hypothetical protein